jgi:hypothetical protein
MSTNFGNRFALRRRASTVVIARRSAALSLAPYGIAVRFSISIPQLDTTRFDAAGIRSYLAHAEELGFEGGWVLEMVVGEAPLLAPLELLAYAAACTERLRLGVAVLVSTPAPTQSGVDSLCSCRRMPTGSPRLPSTVRSPNR